MISGNCIKGRTVVITGAAHGLGEGLARILADEGANLVIADLDETAGKAVAEELDGKDGRKCLFVRTDVSDEDSVRNLVDETVRTFGALDVMISNAGILHVGSLEELCAEDLDKVAAVNYRGFFLCAKYAAKAMKRQTSSCPDRYADIIQINSKSGLRGSKANSAYSGSKFGAVGLVQSFALELAPFRIKVNCICPGNCLDGELWSNPEHGLFVQYLNAGKVPGAKTVEDVREYYLSQVPMHKSCTVADIARAVLYAISQTGETGQAIPVTGGQIMLD